MDDLKMFLGFVSLFVVGFGSTYIVVHLFAIIGLLCNSSFMSWYKLTMTLRRSNKRG